MAADLMTAEVIGCRPEDTAISVMERMTDGRFRHMPVIEQNRMIGVISIGDVVKARITEVQAENAAHSTHLRLKCHCRSLRVLNVS